MYMRYVLRWTRHDACMVSWILEEATSWYYESVYVAGRRRHLQSRHNCIDNVLCKQHETTLPHVMHARPISISFPELVRRSTMESSRSHWLKLWQVHNPPPREHSMIADLLQYSDLAAFLRCDEANTVRHTCKQIQQDPLLAKRGHFSGARSRVLP